MIRPEEPESLAAWDRLASWGCWQDDDAPFFHDESPFAELDSVEWELEPDPETPNPENE